MTSYTEAQTEWISCLNETLQIIACAGSGKTRVISRRIAGILAQHGVQPRTVVTFSPGALSGFYLLRPGQFACGEPNGVVHHPWGDGCS